MQLNVTIKDREVRDLVSRIQRRFHSPKPAFEIIGEIVQASIQRNFERGGRPRKWRKLSKVTKALRKKQGKWPGQILVRSARLKSIVYRASSDQVAFAANEKYAAVQHFGAKKGSFGTVTANIQAHTRRLKSGQKTTVKAHTKKMKLPWGDIPARRFMMVHKEDWDEIREALTDFILLGRTP